jgi:hypothetical protein
MIFVEPGPLDAYEVVEKDRQKESECSEFSLSSGIINGYVLP